MSDVAADALARIEELRRRMEEEGEPVADAAAAGSLAGELVLEQRMRLVGRSGSALYAVPVDEDWMHDALSDEESVTGTLYASDEPFPVGAAAVTGYFQADGDGLWARVAAGRAEEGADGVEWKEGLEEFPEVVSQFMECMAVPEYRHAAERAALQRLASDGWFSRARRA
ncbi:hypothetical protein B5F40_12915 [Gordonibacter sp. An230]|uniref:hypothetical protein n=1 Tax=Gordonibacter sp. An230 TaxID=1965592 RepID=UPI000B3760A4|nr:hypothetical protein [Gordonibacter sp. An230]OUO88040.1 hypothetical protein B5F40_12915 [Gordonibacter sp. An230]